jgi:hypothetical protein
MALAVTAGWAGFGVLALEAGAVAACGVLAGGVGSAVGATTAYLNEKFFNISLDCVPVGTVVVPPLEKRCLTLTNVGVALSAEFTIPGTGGGKSSHRRRSQSVFGVGGENMFPLRLTNEGLDASFTGMMERGGSARVLESIRRGEVEHARRQRRANSIAAISIAANCGLVMPWFGPNFFQNLAEGFMKKPLEFVIDLSAELEFAGSVSASLTPAGGVAVNGYFSYTGIMYVLPYLAVSKLVLASGWMFVPPYIQSLTLGATVHFGYWGPEDCTMNPEANPGKIECCKNCLTFDGYLGISIANPGGYVWVASQGNLTINGLLNAMGPEI